MKTVNLGQATLDPCIDEAQRERVVVTRNGKPVALVIGLDEERMQLGSSQKFWDFLSQRRAQKTISRAEMERRIESGR